MSKTHKRIADSWLTEPRVDDQNTTGETLTQMEHAADCDINVQIKRFQALGLSPHRPLDPAQCKDLSDLHADLIQANNVIVAARDAFDALDDSVKRRFSGSPALYLDFMANLSENADEARSLGLLEPIPQPVPPPSPSTKAASTPPSAPPSGAPSPDGEGHS